MEGGRPSRLCELELEERTRARPPPLEDGWAPAEEAEAAGGNTNEPLMPPPLLLPPASASACAASASANASSSLNNASRRAATGDEPRCSAREDEAAEGWCRPLRPGVDAALPLATDDVSEGGGAVRPISGGEGEDSEEDEGTDPPADAADAANAKGERAPTGNNAPPATPLRPDAVFAGVTGGCGMGVDRTGQLGSALLSWRQEKNPTETREPAA
jgi:hypothetical protein